jgi:hypothetical protein
MARLYLFAVGGSGARVLKALSHLLAAGAPLCDPAQNPLELVPLVIDPDADNGDTLDCLQTLADYSNIREAYLGSTYAGDFFKTRIRRFQELHDQPAAGPATATAGAQIERGTFRCGIVDRERHQTFADVIGYPLLSVGPARKATKILIDSLYSRDNLATELSGGFLGNPNLGTIVLNKVQHSREYRMLPGLFHQGDHIFIISSIFGGTGAAGFPVLVKLLREAKDEDGNALPVLADARIGALSVLPYFSLEADRQSPVDSGAFIPKTKAALTYYAEHLTGLQSLYYIADKAGREYGNRPTGNLQRNPEHPVEWIGASAVLHFASTQPAPEGTSYYECAVQPKTPEASLDLSTLGHNLTRFLEEPLTRFALATRYLDEATTAAALPQLLAQPWTREGRYDALFWARDATSTPFGALTAYTQRWWASLAQLAGNDRGFRPFLSSGDLADLRPDRRAAGRLDRNHVDIAMNRLPGNRCGDKRSLARLLRMLSNATLSLYARHYRVS